MGISALSTGRIAAAASLALVLALSAGCGPTDREAELRAAIHGMADAAEQKKPGPILERIADDFTGESGAMDANAAKRYVLAQTLSRDRLSVSLGDIQITLHGDRATASIRASFAGRAAWFPGRGVEYRFDTGWRLDDGEWRIIRADWRQTR